MDGYDTLTFLTVNEKWTAVEEKGGGKERK